MEYIALAIASVLIVALVLKYKGSFESKYFNISSSKKDESDIGSSFDDMFSDIWQRTKHIDKKIRSILKEYFIEIFIKETNCSYNEALNNLELKRYVSLLVRTSHEEIRPGLLKELFRNGFPSGTRDFEVTCRDKTDTVMDLATSFLTREWTLNFDRSLTLRLSDEAKDKVYLICQQYFEECLKVKDKSAKVFSEKSKEQVLLEYKSRFDKYQLRFM